MSPAPVAPPPYPPREPMPGHDPVTGGPRRDRGDACPGTLRLHTAEDGALARVRIPGGVLTVSQAQTLADAATRLGDGNLHLTSRGNVQLRGLAKDRDQDRDHRRDQDHGQHHAPPRSRELADLLRSADLLPSPRHERVRNIVASPLSGLDGNGQADVLPWVRRLDRLLCVSEAAEELSGRFLFAFDDGRGDVAALGADVTVIAHGTSGALLRIGSEAPPEAHPQALAEAPPADVATLLLPAAHAPRAALLAAELFLTAARASGTPRWRIRDLPGAAALLARGVADRLAESQTGTVGPYEPGHAPRAAGPPPPGLHPGPASVAALCVAAPLGRLTSTQWRLLATVAERDGSGELRVNPWRGIVLPGLPGLPARTARDRLAELADAGLITSPASPQYGVGACAGRPGCAKSHTDVRADAATTTAATTAAATPHHPTHPLPVYWSGCERRCGHPQDGDWVDVVATPTGYDIAVTGEPPHTAVTDPAALAAAVAAARTARSRR